MIKKSGKSRVYKHGGKCFRYDWDRCVVEFVWKPTAKEMKMIKADNDEWLEKFGEKLWDIDDSGCIVSDSIGLSPEHWADKEARDEYLDEYCADLDYMCGRL